MLKLNSYYQLVKGESKTRYDVQNATWDYSIFDNLSKKGKLWFYLTDGDYTQERNPLRKGRFKLVANQKIGRSAHLSKVFEINETYAYGDIKNCSDLFLYSISSDLRVIDLFIAQGQRNAYNELVCGLYGGIHKDLQTQVEALMRRAKVKSI